MKNSRKTLLLAYVSIIAVFFISHSAFADSKLLSPAENLWLKSRNNTIVVYPIKDFPPYSYESTAGTPEGLSIDYIELIAQKLGIKIQYLEPRPLSQVIDDMKTGKADVTTSVSDTREREGYLYFTDNYISVSSVIVVRKDYDKGDIRTINDLTGKKIAVIDGSALEDFIHTNNPRAVIEPVTDDEIALQQVVLGEDDAAAMDIASLSYYLSKQVLSSVRVSGTLGLEYKPAFAISKDKQVLQSILDKGLQQVSTSDRQTFNDKWIVVPGEKVGDNSFISKIENYLGPGILYIIFTLGLVAIIFALVRHRRYGGFHHHHRRPHLSELKEEIEDLEDTSQGLVEELQNVKDLEKDIKDKIKKIELD